MRRRRGNAGVFLAVTTKPILVGETNPYGGNPDYALYPDPPGSGGERLYAGVVGVALGRLVFS